MQTISSLFNNNERYTEKQIKQLSKRKTERGELIEQFVEILNRDRVGYKPLEVSHVGYLLSIYPTSELYFFLNKCKEAKHFGSCFWYHVKPKRTVDN